ncbi:MAG: hypothetical protein SOT60_00395 [Bilifractor sp.]|nr:hypothetical protein [Bilifractor sp.]
MNVEKYRKIIDCDNVPVFFSANSEPRPNAKDSCAASVAIAR